MDYSLYEYRAALYKAVVEKNGMEHQIMKAVEEMAELTKALCDHRQRRCYTVNVAEEIADVRIMLEQLELILGCGKDVDREMHHKIARLCIAVDFEGGDSDDT